MNCIGIRHEDKYVMERRVPITPKHIRRLKKLCGLRVIVESSAKRVFKDEEFIKAGAEIKDNLSECNVIFGVKEIPINKFEARKTYIIFSHVIKGQQQNMPMLKRMMELGCNLIDYEKIADETGRRLVFFGKYAGLAGMINSFWALGLRLRHYGHDNPFTSLKQAHHYTSLDEAKKAISEVGHYIAEKGLPDEILPLTIGFTGYGNVSNGAQELCGLLPVMEISHNELLTLKEKNSVSKHLIYKVIFREEDMVEPIDSNQEFDLVDYYTFPSNYKSVFEKYVPHLTMLMNCMYWDERYPRIITKNFMQKLYSKGLPKLTVIGDISCDIEGSVECTLKATEIEHPIYVYNPFDKNIKMGYESEGILIMAVDILPSELPRDSSMGFGDILYNFVKPIADADFTGSFDDIKLPFALKNGMILHKGELTANYKYIQKFLSI
jgi:alpha-aminoadipic semialdehyde synthase